MKWRERFGLPLTG